MIQIGCAYCFNRKKNERTNEREEKIKINLDSDSCFKTRFYRLLKKICLKIKV